MPALIECAEFSFAYHAMLVLERINFRVDAGEWLSVVGPNGSGKSTLLKNLLRLVKGRQAGELRINGRSIRDFSQKALARLLAYVPQAGGQLPPFTAREFLRLSRYPFGPLAGGQEPVDSEAIERAFTLTRTSQFAEMRLDQLSGGQRQCVFLAAAIAQGATALLLDEPATFLDPRNASELHELLQRLHLEAGLTIIAVTHDLSRLLDCHARALVLREGRQLFFGSACDLEANGILEQAFSYQFSYLKHPRNGRTLVIA